MNIEISGALFKLSLSILELNTQSKEGVTEVNIH